MYIFVIDNGTAFVLMQFYHVLGAFLFLFLWVGLSIININKHKCVK